MCFCYVFYAVNPDRALSACKVDKIASLERVCPTWDPFYADFMLDMALSVIFFVHEDDWFSGRFAG